LLRFEIGNALPDPKNPETIEVKGRDFIMEIPKVLSIDSEEIRVAISEQIDAIKMRTSRHQTAEVGTKGAYLLISISSLAHASATLLSGFSSPSIVAQPCSSI
jgi:hypothetical protein